MKYTKLLTTFLVICLIITGLAFAEGYPCNGTIIKNAVNVRKKSNVQSDKVASLKNGDAVTVLGEELAGSTIWYHIEMKNGKTGYVRGDLIEVGTTSVSQSNSSDSSSTASAADTITEIGDTTFIESVSFKNFQITFKTQTTFSCDSIQTEHSIINGTTYTFFIYSGGKKMGWIKTNSGSSSQLAIQMVVLDDDAPSFDKWAKQITSINDLDKSSRFRRFIDAGCSALRTIYPDKSDSWIKAFFVDLIKEYSKNGSNPQIYLADDDDFNELYRKSSSDIVAENGFCFGLWGMSNGMGMLIRETEKNHIIPVQPTSNISASNELSTSAAPANDTQSADVNIPTYVTLKSGANGDDVVNLQDRLAEIAYFFDVPNGIYGDSTVKAVKEFQGDADLKATGIADEQTQQLLYSNEAWSIRADALEKKSIDSDVYARKAKSFVSKWDGTKVGSYIASASADSSGIDIALPLGKSLFEMYSVQLYIP